MLRLDISGLLPYKRGQVAFISHTVVVHRKYTKKYAINKFNPNIRMNMDVKIVLGAVSLRVFEKEEKVRAPRRLTLFETTASF